jgi:glycosyltransferase involved in cell wall biosynthesis
MDLAVVVPYYKPAYVYGGPARSIPAMCEALAELGAQVTVFTTDANGAERLNVPLGRALNVSGVTVWYFPVIVGGSFFYSPGLAAACKAKISEFDLAVLDTLYTHAMGPAIAACKSAKIPYIIPLRGQLLPWSLHYRRWKKQLYLSLMGRRYIGGAAGLHCTDLVEAEAASALGLRAPTFVVPNGLDFSNYARLPERGRLRQRWGIPEEASVLLFLGRLHHKKRPDIAVEVLAALQSLPQPVHLVMAGPDEEKMAPALIARSQEAGCRDRLHLVGLLQGTGVLQALADADLFLMPSEPMSENFGMSAMEAMAAGIPILVSEGVPLGPVAERAGAGRMVPCNAQAFSRVAREWLSEPAQLKALGQQGRLLVKEHFDIKVVARAMLNQYQSIINTGKPLAANHRSEKGVH